MSLDRPRSTLQRLPLPGFFAVVLVLWVVLQMVFDSHRADAISIGTHVIGGIVFATVLTLGIWAITDPEARWLGVLVAVLTVAAIMTPRRLARIDRLRTQVGRGLQPASATSRRIPGP